MPTQPTTAGPDIQANLDANTPKRNIRVCADKIGRTTLFCEECRGQGHDWDKIRHGYGCRTARALAKPTD